MRRQRLAGISPRKFTPVTAVIDLDLMGKTTKSL
jgi:hypothetical protein